MVTLSEDKITELLKDVFDPEIPVLNIVEMGILRKVILEEDKIIIKITPTYSGCPAMKTIEDEIKDLLFSEGFENVEVRKIYSPAWTTDWFTEEAKIKLKKYGITPPEKLENTDPLKEIIIKKTDCPFCDSIDTKLTSEFGSTSCKSLHFCNSCVQPFEKFKCI